MEFTEDLRVLQDIHQLGGIHNPRLAADQCLYKLGGLVRRGNGHNYNHLALGLEDNL